MNSDKQMYTGKRFDLTIEKGKGTYVYDVDGSEYLDFTAGYAVNALGHCNEIMINAIKEQSQKIFHISDIVWNPIQTKLANFLVEKSGMESVFIGNSGSEAIDGALKLAKKYGNMVSKGDDKYEIISMVNAFHGRTIGSTSITGKEKYKKSFYPLIPGTKNVPLNDIEALEKAMSSKVCAVVIEPIQGEGGVVPSTIEFLEAARSLCDKFDALLIFDEVQCGMGRIGELFAYNFFGVQPDIVCIAKGLGGGFPIGALLSNKRADLFQPGDHGSTFGGNPLACAVSYAVMQEISKESFLEGVKEKGEYFKKNFAEKAKGMDFDYEIRGEGLLIGIDIGKSPAELVNQCIKNGLLIIGAGETVLRVIPPLTVSKEELDKGIDIILKSIAELSN
jgi:acetylornithine/N-succinyldiaminopimelate aminotransferase